MHNQVIYVQIDSIQANAYQPRKYFNQEALEELAQSIKQYGVIQPITVRRLGNVFEIVAGERRWRASKLAGLKKVPCAIVDITNTESAEIALLENLQREDLNFIEEAEAYNNLITDHKFTQEKLAEKMGKKQSTIANKLRLLKLNDEVRRKCLEGDLTERHTRALLSLPNEELQKEVIQAIIKDSLNVKKTEELINRILLKLAGEDLSGKKETKNIKGSFPTKIYVNSIKQIFDKFKIPAKYTSKDCGDSVQITVTIAKTKK
ncbi:MAG: nucleoid occlusion protein [Sarcina sp.]